MEQKCENCKWEGAPCDVEHCRTICNNEGWVHSEVDDHWTPAKPWEDKWIVPEGCEILSETEEYCIGTVPGEIGVPPLLRAAKWKNATGHCFVGHTGFSEFNLIPKTPPIEETEEFKAWRKFWELK